MLGLGPRTRGLVIFIVDPVVHDGLDGCSAHGVRRNEGVPNTKDLLVA